MAIKSWTSGKSGVKLNNGPFYQSGGWNSKGTLRVSIGNGFDRVLVFSIASSLKNESKSCPRILPYRKGSSSAKASLVGVFGFSFHSWQVRPVHLSS